MASVKRLTKLLISIIFFLSTLVRDSLCQLFGATPRATCVVLGYHSIGAESRALFAKQMDDLITYTTPIRANNRLALRPNERFAAVTFDDGFLSVVQNAVPELVARGIPATFFVVAGFLGATPDWITFDEEYIGDERTVSVGDLRNLPADLLTIGSHTASHPWLPSLPEALARVELVKSREMLASLTNRDVTLFSFPYGAQNDQLARWCREAGYERVFTTVPKLAFTDPLEFVTGRVRVDPFDWPVEFRLKLMGAYCWMSWAFLVKHKLFSRLFPNKGYPDKSSQLSVSSK
jgi:peptidoglycan/xylan/chitin deacetylase (PgdA/CDA1 family)